MSRSRALGVGLAAAPLALLGIARLLPADGAAWVWLRLAAATLVVLVPGSLVARAIGQRTAAALVGWTLAALAGALALTFALRASLATTIGLLGGVALVALPFALPRRLPRRPAGGAVVVLVGAAFGVALWHVAGVIHGDAYFHLARIRKLDELGSLSLRSLDEFRDGGLHPGYAFPLWHGFVALVAKLGGVDAGVALLHEPSVIAPLAFLLVYEAGVVVFGSAWLGGAVLAASIALYALAPGGGGAFATLALPGTVSRQLLVPALVTLFFCFVRAPSWRGAGSVAAVALAIAFVHPTYALFVAVPLGAFILVRLLVARRDLVHGLAALAAIAVPVGLVVLWLAPIVAETVSHNPTAATKLASLHHYASDLVVSSPHRYHLKSQVFARTGAVAVAALVLVPLAALGARRRWAAFVLGGSVVWLAVELSPFLFPRFADAVSLSQARRAAGFVPFAFAFAGGVAVAARLLRWAVLPASLAAGIVLQHEFPGDFGLELGRGGTSLPAWIALAGGAAALVAAILLARRFRPLDRSDWLPLAASLLFVLPVAVHGFRDWSPRTPHDGYAPTPGLVRALRRHVPSRGVVYADAETSYRIVAALPVYIAVAPPAHVADTKANRPYRRLARLRRFLRTGDLRIPQAAGARWLVLTRGELRRPAFRSLRLPRRYADDRFALFELPRR